MRIIVAIIIASLLFTGAASAAEVESPPVPVLENNGSIAVPVAGNYSWSYPTGKKDEWNAVEACGMAPTDPRVWNTFDHVLLMEEETYTISWKGIAPDQLTVFSWDIAVFADQDHIDVYQENPEIILHPAGGKITLKPDRVYVFQAKWQQEESGSKAYGSADYYLVTEKLIMLDGPDSIMMGGWSPSPDPAVTEKLKAVFDKGISTLTGASAVPVAYLGSQAVAGTNHAFLCQVVTAYPGTINAYPSYAIVYLCEDLQGNVSILNIVDFDIGSLCTYGAD